MFVFFAGILCIALFLCDLGRARQIYHKNRHAAFPFGVAGMVSHVEHGTLTAIVQAVNHMYSAHGVNLSHPHGLYSSTN